MSPSTNVAFLAATLLKRDNKILHKAVPYAELLQGQFE